MTKSILVVDDESGIRHILRMILEAEGFDVLETDNGLEALRQIRHNQPDAIIADIMMPKMDGFTMCRALRLKPTTADIPIIMMSGSSDPDNMMDSLRSGANAYLSKPSMFDAIVRHLQDLLFLQPMAA